MRSAGSATGLAWPSGEMSILGSSMAPLFVWYNSDEIGFAQGEYLCCGVGTSSMV